MTAAMPSADAACVLMVFILCISGDQGQENIICALKGSSVDLHCSAQHPTTSAKWYTVHRNDSKDVLRKLSTDDNRVTYNVSPESDFTLTIKDLGESDYKKYCCRESTDQPDLCWKNSTELRVADLQVKVIPSTEGLTVTLMCSSSCPLTENPAAYIWYKNREFLYEDWSPWYQQLVSSEAAVRYSCAIKGYEDLRAPEVSVDSVTLACFSVTYAKGKMCSYVQKSEDEPCSITYPTELHAQKTSGREFITLTCNTSCPKVDPHAAFRWYWNRELYSHCENQDITLFGASSQFYHCAVKGHEDLRSDEACVDEKSCRSVNYVTRRICALEGSSVNISRLDSWTYGLPHYLSWRKRGDEEAESLKGDAGHLEFHQHSRNVNTLTINNLTKDDSAEYVSKWSPRGQFGLLGATLVVTGLKVTFTPSAVVTEGQRVTLTCSTSCPLNADYTWTFNSRPLTLPEDQNKQLVLDPVRKQHAGNYSCAVGDPQNITSSERTLTVMPLQSMAIMNAVKMTLLSLIPIAVCVLYLTIRKKKTQTELAGKVQTGETEPLYDDIRLSPMNPAARAEPAEQQEDTV
ncbi:B-cell receptor CD22-like [Pagrus major]|uniref:B-cell receptor CD22-like n=1 Tax=Pagrus major TaxID=143350 RepID=UPI003CC8AF9A